MESPQPQIQVNDLLAIIGSKEVELVVLRRTVAQLQAALQAAAGEAKSPKVVPFPDAPRAQD